MVLKECYDALGEDYEAVRQRISKEETIRKFVIKFLSEPSYGNLCESLQSGKYEEAFRAAHSLKGVSTNLGFQKLGNSASTLTEYLRGSDKKQIDPEECRKLMECVSGDYDTVVEVVRKLEEA